MLDFHASASQWNVPYAQQCRQVGMVRVQKCRFMCPQGAHLFGKLHEVWQSWQRLCTAFISLVDASSDQVPVHSPSNHLLRRFICGADAVGRNQVFEHSQQRQHGQAADLQDKCKQLCIVSKT